MKKYKKSGWYGESLRHSLARKGIKTKGLSSTQQLMMLQLNYQKNNDIQTLISQAEKEALEARKERIGFSKKKKKINYQKGLEFKNGVQFEQPEIEIPKTEQVQITQEEFDRLPEEHKEELIERGWIGRGLRKEAEFGKKIVKGVTKPVTGFLRTGISGLLVRPEDINNRTNYAKKVRKMKKKCKKVNYSKSSKRLSETMSRFAKNNVKSGEKFTNLLNK